MSGLRRFLCIHGHFYQPPRENAWLEAIEAQSSAAPYHDWNERINYECYAANGRSRILNEENRIVRIVNNYSRISFNFGPTLLAWMEQNAPLTYARVVHADRVSRGRFGGHGSAIAQVYNHAILPLADRQDRVTQIRWGIADFVHRFGRRPEGMWLAETAVDLETLDLLAQEGVLFTVLAPHQCARVRSIANEDDPEAPAWHETPYGNVDPTQPYLVHTGPGRGIAVFFYDGGISRAVAFEGLLNNGLYFASRLQNGFRQNGRAGQLVHIATDGESYGHHHRHGDMALAYALDWIEREGDVQLTNYGQFLEEFPPASEAEIYENTSWSCAHGVERWQSDCGCGSAPGKSQAWRAPLRNALDWLRDSVRPMWTLAASQFLLDSGAARDAYIDVVLHRDPASQQRFFDAHAHADSGPADRTAILKLMELERHLQLMYTSCGWFFDDLAGIETIQIVSYAGRVLQLAAELFGDAGAALEEGFLSRLAQARGNGRGRPDGASLYRKHVPGHAVGLEQVGAHFAIVSLFEPQPERSTQYCFDIHHLGGDVLTSGRGRVAFGQAEICSRITLERAQVDYAVLHLGDQNVSAAVRPTDADNPDSFFRLSQELRAAVARADLPEVVRLFARDFGAARYSLRSLFRDDQRRILQVLLDSTQAKMEDTLRTIYEDHVSLLRYLSTTGMPKPQPLVMAAQFSLNADLRGALTTDPFDAALVRRLLADSGADQIPLDGPTLAYAASQRMLASMRRLERSRTLRDLESSIELLELLLELPFEVDHWETQNLWYRILREERRHSKTGPPDASPDESAWGQRFAVLGNMLNIDVEQLTVDI